MGPMRKPSRMEGHHARFNVVAAKKVTSVIEQHFIVVIIIVVKTALSMHLGRSQSGAWYKGAHYKTQPTNVVCAEGGKW